MEKRKMYRDPETGLLFLAPLIGVGVKAAAKAAAKRQNQDQFAPQQQALAAQQAQLVAQQAQLKQQQQALQEQQQLALKASIAQAKAAPVPVSSTVPTAPVKAAGFADTISKAATPTGALAAGVLGAGAGYLYAGEKPMGERVKFALAGGLGGYMLLLNLPMIYARVTGQPLPTTTHATTVSAAAPAVLPANLPRLPSVPEMLQMSEPVYNGMWSNVLALYQQAGVDITPYQTTKAKVDLARKQMNPAARISGIRRRR